MTKLKVITCKKLNYFVYEIIISYINQIKAIIQK